jgi:uncharacterized membrane protein YeiH
LDVVGIVVCGFLAAFGGGTLRDVLIDRRSFFGVDHQLVLMGVLLLCVACASFCYPPFARNDGSRLMRLTAIMRVDC